VGLLVLSSFPRAMLSMSAAFGLWRAGLISNALFAVGVAVVVLGVLGGTAWMSGGFWAPDGAYSRFVCPAIGLVWVLIVSRVLLSQSPAVRAGW
jgi:multisubunit Na+/H+ antiporter MnhB subunit